MQQLVFLVGMEGRRRQYGGVREGGGGGGGRGEVKSGGIGVKKRVRERETKKHASVCGGREGWDKAKIGGKRGSEKGEKTDKSGAW